MRIVIHPLSSPDRELDVTAGLVRAIAEVLTEIEGSNPALNELEAERHLWTLVQQGPGRDPRGEVRS
jgi:hypothetical protein